MRTSEQRVGLAASIDFPIMDEMELFACVVCCSAPINLTFDLLRRMKLFLLCETGG